MCIVLPNFGKLAKLTVMSTMNISLPDELKAFVDQRIKADGYGTSSEYMRELIRRDKDCQQFREYLLNGMNAPAAGNMDADYFVSLRAQVKNRASKNRPNSAV